MSRHPWWQGWQWLPLLALALGWIALFAVLLFGAHR